MSMKFSNKMSIASKTTDAILSINNVLIESLSATCQFTILAAEYSACHADSANIALYRAI